jgi:Raf kinase inhibitor-like YbhB/YbcL family protein
VLANAKFIEATQKVHVAIGTEKDVRKYKLPGDIKECGILMVDALGDELSAGCFYTDNAPEDVAIKIINMAINAYDSGLEWQDSVEKGIAKARKRNKPLVILMVDDKNPSQKTLEAFNSREFRKLRKSFIFTKITFNKESDIAKKWSVASAPCAIIINPFGADAEKPLKQISGQKDNKALVKDSGEAQKAYDEIKKKQPKSEQVFVISSTTFEDGDKLPARHLDFGECVSPNLSWTEIESAKSYAIICSDAENLSDNPAVFWVIFNIPGSVTEIPENISKVAEPGEVKGAKQGTNSASSLGYIGLRPQNNEEVREYHFTLYALDTVLELKGGVDVIQVWDAIKGHIIKQASLMGTNKRKK